MNNEDLADTLINTFCGIWLSLRATTTAQDLQMYKVQLMKGLVSQNLNSPESIARGVALIRISGGQYPPSVPQFVQWCKPDKKEQCHILLPRLAQMESTAEQRAEFIASMSAAMKGIK
jgi:hypothetical protein